MKNKTILDTINSEDNINETISRDEEKEAVDNELRLQLAENLILELPPSHEGRKQWLVKYGQSEEAKQLRRKMQL